MHTHPQSRTVLPRQPPDDALLLHRRTGEVALSPGRPVPPGPPTVPARVHRDGFGAVEVEVLEQHVRDRRRAAAPLPCPRQPPSTARAGGAASSCRPRARSPVPQADKYWRRAWARAWAWVRGPLLISARRRRERESRRPHELWACGG